MNKFFHYISWFYLGASLGYSIFDKQFWIILVPFAVLRGIAEGLNNE